MDSRPLLETRPPALIETVVRLLVPAPCREHVVGDLWERYRSPHRFLVDAARTLPFVVASQIRRTSTVSSAVIQAFVLSVAFATVRGPLLRNVIPVVAGLLGLVLRDAYKCSASMSPRQVGVDVAVGAFCVLASQAFVGIARPELLVPLPGLLACIVAFGLLFLVRLQSPGLGSVSRQAIAQFPQSLDGLLAEVRLCERINRRAIRIEVWTGFAVAAVFLAFQWSAPNWVTRVGLVLASAYGVYVACFVSTHAPQTMPDGLGFRGSLVFYRRELEARHALVRTMWRWYLLPFLPGLFTMLLGAAMKVAARGRPTWPIAVVGMVVVGVGVIAHVGSLQMASKLRSRIDGLKALEDR